MNAAPPDMPSSADTPVSRDKPWSALRWIVAIALMFGLHIGLIWALGSRKPVALRAVRNAPVMVMAARFNEFQELEDPTLFALPHPRGYASATWLRLPRFALPPFRWTEPPRLLALSPQQLGETFVRIANSNDWAVLRMGSLPPARFTEAPPAEISPAGPRESRLSVRGALAERRLLNAPALPAWPSDDPLTNSLVRVFVDARGNVFSPALQRPGSGSKDADQFALRLAREARFSAGPKNGDTLAKGLLIFEWQTVPKTNAPAASP